MSESLHKKVKRAMDQAGVSFSFNCLDTNIYEVKVARADLAEISDKLAEATKNLMAEGVKAKEVEIKCGKFHISYFFSLEEEGVCVSVVLL